MARSTPSKSPSLLSDASPNSAPSSKKLGILSRTLFHSPEINFIFPLRIRDWDKQDVALIGDRFVHIQELRHGTFHHVATKADFPARIRAAQVLGSTDYEPLDGQPGEDDQQHAHVLLLVLENHTLVLLTMTKDLNHHDVFSIRSCPTSANQHLQCSVGKYLAVDPYSRAFAVGAAVDTIEFVRMSPRSHWARDGSNVLQGQSLLRTHMKIVKMDFLHVPQRAADIIQLLVVGYRTESNPRAHLSAQVWSIHPSQSEALPQLVNSQDTGVYLAHGVPQILIPLRRFPGAFILACDENIAIYSAQAGHVKSKGSSTVHDLCSDHPNGLPRFLGSSKGAPLWKAWARPRRNDRFRNGRDQIQELDSECLYIAREDGALCYLYVKPDLSYYWGEGGTLNGIIGSAFNHDGGSGEAPDGLIFGGSLSDGGIYMAGQTTRRGTDARSREKAMAFCQTAALYNWAPFIDITPVPAAAESGSYSQQSPFQPVAKLLSTSGKLPYGAATELRFGCEAVVSTILECRERVHFTRMAAFTTSDGHPAMLLSSPAGRTCLMHGIEASCPDASTSQMTLFAEEEMIAASRLPHTARGAEGTDDYVFSVGPLALSVSKLAFDTQGKCTLIVRVVETQHPGTIVAAVDEHQQRALVATNTDISLYQFESDEVAISQLGSSIALDQVPTCTEMFKLGRSFYALVSDDFGGVRAFGIDSTGLHPSTESVYLGEGPQLCCALAILPIPGMPDEARALCGQRGGGLVVLRLHRIRETGCLRMRILDPLDSKSVAGTRPIDKCHCSASNDGSALVLCGSETMHVRFRSSQSDTPIVNRVYLTDPADSSFLPGTLRAAACIPISTTNSTSSDQLLCLDDSAIYIALLDSLPKALPLRTSLSSQPNRIVYSEDSKTSFVAAVRPFHRDKRRYLMSLILAVSESPTTTRTPEAVYVFGPGESISSLNLWHRQREREDGSLKTMQYLIANTIDRNENLIEAGTIRLFKISSTNEDNLKLTQQRCQRENRPITAMCSFDDDNLLYCAGSHIKRLRLPRRSGRDGECEASELETPKEFGGAQFMSAHPPYVHISTITGSLVTFHFDSTDDKLTEVYRDDTAAHGLSHLVVAVNRRAIFSDRCSSLALFSDKKGTVAGHWLGSSTVGKHVMPRAFEAKLPISITKFVKCHVRPPWKCLLPNNPLIRQTMERHVMTRDVLGTATDGSLWSFAVLGIRVWRLLKFVEHMCMRDERICSGLGIMDWHMMGHVMPEDSSSARHYHVDGDVLSRLVERPDAEDILAGMLHAVLRGPGSGPGPGSGDRSPPLDFDNSLDKERAFCRLVSELRQDPGQAGESMSPPSVEHLHIEDGDEDLPRHGGFPADNNMHGQMVATDVGEVVGLIRWLVEIPL